MNNLWKFDKQHIWHPYTSMKNPLPVYPVKCAEGVTITLADGRKLIDGMASWWCAIHGYNHPAINAAVCNQLAKMSHVMFGGLTHEPAALLAQKLIAMTPKALDYVFFADSGSVAVEVAMKMAQQYWYSLNQKQKKKFLTIRGGYHGDTYHAMSVCDPINGMHSIYQGSLPEYFFAPKPETKFGSQFDSADILPLRALIEKNHQQTAALILEPIVQGAGGMYFYSAEYLNQAVKLCHEYDLLVIYDEIATGFGRTGKLFALEHTATVPDILCLGKALTGGYLTLSAVLTNDKIAEGISSCKPGVFMHGPTFMANPLACSAANASIDLLQQHDWQSKVKKIEQILQAELFDCQNYSSVANVRVLGAIGVIELKKIVDMKKFQKKIVDKGVWLRPFGKLLYTMPPYIINEQELKKITRCMKELAAEF
jgi:adenosylmethionine-8-amino-7-oxononanoate aminotransferase